MKPAYSLAIDFSQWNTDADLITPEEVEAWKAAGVTKAIIGAGYHDPAVQQIRACADGGLEVEVYRYLFWGRSMREQVKYALGIVKAADRPVGRLWLDAEDPSIWPVAEMRTNLKEAKRACGKMPAGIYSRKNWWEMFTGSYTAFAKLPLWDSNPDGIADMSSFQPYGGWKSCKVRQYAFDVPLGGGRKVDLNVYSL